MLRVLQVIPTLDRAGAEKQMTILARGLPRSRFHVEVAALTRLGPFEADLRAAGIPVTLIGKRFKLDPPALHRLTRLMRAGRYDVVQTWIFAANVYGRVAARLAKIPIVITAEMAVDLWKSPRQLKLDRWLARWTDRVVGNSQAVVDFYRARAAIPPEKLCRIVSGIESIPQPRAAERREARLGLGVPDDAYLVLYAGRLAPQKAVDVLIDAIDLLHHIRPQLVTLIAGDGPERGRLESRARAFEILGRQVRFLGAVDPIDPLLAAADLVVLPSRYEGLPNIVLEAMQAGLPVVATAAPGTRELVVDDETGLLVPVDDHVALARAIQQVMDEPARARQYGAAGRRRVAADFSATVLIEQFATLYESLARSGQVNPAPSPGESAAQDAPTTPTEPPRG